VNFPTIKASGAGETAPYILRKDGQHRLETNWRLLIFLLLEIHLHSVHVREVADFIRLYAKRPAETALRALTTDLRDRYKNFPPKQGWSFRRKADETGFRKIIVTDDGMLRIITL
jgi:hypothetical protein